MMKLIGVCDNQFKKDGVVDNGVLFFNNHYSLLAADLDALIVCLPNDVAPIVTNRGLEKGLHVFCEKPPGRTVEDVINTRSIEKKNPTLKLMYGFTHRYHDSVQDLDSCVFVRPENY